MLTGNAVSIVAHSQFHRLRLCPEAGVDHHLSAVKDGGEVVVDTRLGAEPETVELRVRDDGHGIPREHLDEVFSPFFTTKDGADGVGLGLSLSLTIVRRLGGTMRVDSM